MKIKVTYNCDGDDTEITTLEAFVNKFNREEINSATDVIDLVEGED